ncbi:cutinase family protein [Mycobacterium talmoniae]|uniref:Cutinase n=1 Tax=Mycobacterium talmoniae TaxID=1858794 RepID=A0A1S1NFH6_9MYCO|nr:MULTISPECIES: cutinase family protein [Mycobacterium]OHU99108.1 cutinase family protein [Mycobacterium talmoniae]PQM46960.1 putative cutinase cut3 [Mycobacterium talmoniae]TDH48380.1 cutinase family protein [Mycobacterium eburneum]
MAGRLALVVTAVVAAGTIATPGAAGAPSCSDIEVVFARGTDEPPGIGVVGQSFVDTLRPMVKGKTLASYAVQYPASWDFAKAAAGATDMSKRVQAIAEQCPKTGIVLGGYSQGAAVVDVVTTAPIGAVGYTAPLPAAAVPHIASVVVFGNPSARIGQPLTRMSPVFGSRTADLCVPNDPVCSAGNDFNAHVRYPQSGLVKLGAQWAARHVNSRG